MTLKIALFAPIPSARVISVATVNPGVWARRRSAYFRSRIRPDIGDSSKRTRYEPHQLPKVQVQGLACKAARPPERFNFHLKRMFNQRLFRLAKGTWASFGPFQDR